MTGPTFYHCATCELVYMADDTHEYYAPGFPTLTSARGCPTCADKLAPIDDADVDPEIFNYLVTL